MDSVGGSTLKSMVGGIALGAVLACVTVKVLESWTFQLTPGMMTYADLSATVLTAVAVLVTTLGVFVAILAIWGYSQFRGIAKASAKSHVDAELRSGQLKAHVEAVVTRFMSEGFDDGELRRLLESRVDQIILSGPEIRSRKSVVDEEHDEDAAV